MRQECQLSVLIRIKLCRIEVTAELLAKYKALNLTDGSRATQSTSWFSECLW